MALISDEWPGLFTAVFIRLLCGVVIRLHQDGTFPDQPDEKGRHLGIKLPARLVFQHGQRLFHRIRGLVGAFGYHGIEGIGDAQYPGAQRDIPAGDAAG